MKTRFLLLVIAAILLPSRAARADLWSIFVQDTGGMGVPSLTVTGDSFLDLVDQLVNTAGAFSAFSGTTLSAQATFAGIPNAITITVDPVGGTATLTFTLLGAGAQTFNFSGANLADQVQQFIQQNLSQQLTAFMQQINQLSLVSVTDGSPMASTARSATYVWDRFALHGDLTGAERRLLLAETEFKPGVRARFDVYGDRISTDVGDGSSVSVATSIEYAFNRIVSLAVLIPLGYTEVEGSDIINAQVTVAVPLNVLRPDAEHPLGVRLVPFVTISGAASADLIAGGLIGGSGLAATMTLDFETVTMSLAAQLSSHEGIVLKYQDFSFDPGVSQAILKGGGKVTLRGGENFYVYAGLTFTQFLEAAAVDSYVSPAIGLGYRDEHNFSVTVGYSGDIADGYRSDGLRVMLQLPF